MGALALFLQREIRPHRQRRDPKRDASIVSTISLSKRNGQRYWNRQLLIPLPWDLFKLSTLERGSYGPLKCQQSAFSCQTFVWHENSHTTKILCYTKFINPAVYSGEKKAQLASFGEGIPILNSLFVREFTCDLRNLGLFYITKNIFFKHHKS